MAEEDTSLGYRLKRKDKTRNHLLEQKSHNESMSQKYENVCRTFNYLEHFLVLIFAVNGCVSIYAFATLATKA